MLSVSMLDLGCNHIGMASPPHSCITKRPSLHDGGGRALQPVAGINSRGPQERLHCHCIQGVARLFAAG